MKIFKKISVLVVAVAMMLNLVSPTCTSAGTVEKGFLQINREGATYDVYKVLNSKTEVIGNKEIPVYSVNPSFENFFNGKVENGGYTFKSDRGILKGETVVVSSDQLRTENSKDGYQQSEEMQNLTRELAEFILENNIVSTKLSGNVNLELDQGYYLVLENKITIENNKNLGRVPSQAMLININKNENVNIFPKDSELTIEKSVESKDDNVAQIGTEKKFEIKSTVPTYASNYKDITYKITDTMSKGLTLKQDSINVMVGGTPIIENGKEIEPAGTYFNEFSYVTNSDGITTTTFDFKYEALKSAALVGQTVKITYEAKINEHALVNDPNSNKAQLDYTTSQDGETTGVITDETKTYTYGLNLFKLDGSNKTTLLAGAKFQIKDNKGNIVGTVISDENGKASFVGLGEGTYEIYEVEAPNDYVKIDGPITIRIVADSQDKSNCTVELVNGNNQIVDELKAVNGTISFNVYNYKGINLPETGGIGTTIFMVAGATLVILSGVMLLVYLKKSKRA